MVSLLLVQVRTVPASLGTGELIQRLLNSMVTVVGFGQATFPVWALGPVPDWL